MFNQNIIAYKFKQDVDYNQEEFEQALQQDKIKPLETNQLSTIGWCNAFGRYEDSLSFFDKNIIALKMQLTERTINSTGLNQLTDEKVLKIEKHEQRPVKKKERDEIKEDILHQYLPYAIPKSSYINAYIDIKRKLVVVDSPSFSKAESVLALLRKSLGSLPVVPLWAKFDLCSILTHYLTSDFSIEEMLLGNQVKLIGDDKETESFTNVILTNERVQQAATEQSLFVKNIELKYNEQVTFTMDDDGAIKKVKFADLLREENADIPKEDMREKLRADLLLTSETVGNMLVAIEKAFIDFVGDPDASL